MSVFRIAADHPCLPGHFPGQPVVPGVVVLDRVLAPGWPLFHFGRIGTPQRDLQAAGWPPAAAPHPYR